MKYTKYSITSLIISILSFGSSYLIFLKTKPELGYDLMGAPIERMYSNIYGDILFFIGIIAFIASIIFFITIIKKKIFNPSQTSQ